MEIVLHAFNGILTILIMVAVGFYLERKGWFSEESVALISRLVNYICLPTYMLTNILSQFKHDQLISLSHGLIVPLISMLTGYFISIFLGRMIGVPRAHQGIFRRVWRFPTRFSSVCRWALRSLVMQAHHIL
ncbi:AEC family transporter [uncultured Phascolarctobacterium sp.]|uniref:AEC family transporter n=1 Tax=uncultured Phascolarctobacterium sp. TaxID=512296 RepID=UPI00262E4B10|nr:AEC family transporter [uncultured Phascolarctobacterium sp.]